LKKDPHDTENMFGNQGRQMAGFVASHVENLVGDHLAKKGNKTTIGKYSTTVLQLVLVVSAER